MSSRGLTIVGLGWLVAVSAGGPLAGEAAAGILHPLAQVAVGHPPDPGRLPDPVIHLPEVADLRIEMEQFAGVQSTRPIISAIIAGDANALRLALKDGHSVTAPIPNHGGTLVGLACIYRRPECLSLLLAQGGDPSARGGPGGLTPLVDATTSKCHECLSILLDKGGEPNELSGGKGSHGRVSPLSNAAAVNDAVAIALLIKAGAMVNGPAGSTSPLIMAAARCNVEAVHALLARDADPNLAAPNGSMTPLTASARAACPSIMTVLLAHGADPHGELKDGVTPLMQAAWWGSTQCVALLLKHDPDFLAMDHSGHDAVMNAALRGHDGVLRMLLAAGGEADRTSAGGWTPLMFAARSGSVACTQTLIDNHADPNVTPRGWTPLKEAARNCHSRIVEVLLAAGANARFRDTDGWSAMDDAARYGCPESLKVLLATDAFDLAAIKRAAADIQDAYRGHHVSKRHAVDVERCRTMLEEHMDSNGKGA